MEDRTDHNTHPSISPTGLVLPLPGGGPKAGPFFTAQMAGQ